MRRNEIAIGPTRHLVGSTQQSEVAHLTRIFRHEEPDRADVTALLQFLREGTSEAFTQEQKTRLVEAASVRVVNQDAHAGLSTQ